MKIDKEYLKLLNDSFVISCIKNKKLINSLKDSDWDLNLDKSELSLNLTGQH